MPYEPAWQAFLDSATAAVQAAAVEAAAAGGALGRRGGPDGGSSVDASAYDWRKLFSVHTHPPPGWSHPAGSVFAGHEVAGRAWVQWGNHSMIDAERALLRAALADPGNQAFQLLSDACLPLYPAPLAYTQLLSEGRSRVNACA